LCENAGSAPDQIKKLLNLHTLDRHEDFSGNEMDTMSATPEFLKALRNEVNNCPACILAVLKQGKIFAFGEFDYKKEKAEYAAEKHRELMSGIGL